MRYPSDVTDEEWAFVSPYLRLMKESAPQRRYPLRELFNGVRWLARAGAPWRYLPKDFPSWRAVYLQYRRWEEAGCFARVAHALRELDRTARAARKKSPTAVILDGRTLCSTPESGERAGFDGHKRTKGSKVHIAVDTLGNLLEVVVTPANEQERHQVGCLLGDAQHVAKGTITCAFADQGYTGDSAKEAAANHGVELSVIRLPEVKGGFVLLPRRWVVERTFAWISRFRRLERDYERLPETLRALHFLAFATILLSRLKPFIKVQNIL